MMLRRDFGLPQQGVEPQVPGPKFPASPSRPGPLPPQPPQPIYNPPLKFETGVETSVAPGEYYPQTQTQPPPRPFPFPYDGPPPPPSPPPTEAPPNEGFPHPTPPIVNPGVPTPTVGPLTPIYQGYFNFLGRRIPKWWALAGGAGVLVLGMTLAFISGRRSAAD